MDTSQPTRRDTSTCSTVVHCSKASSTTDFTGISLGPRNMPSLQSTALAPASLMRSARLRALNPQNTTLWMAPMRAQASTPTTRSGIMGMYTTTRSPLPMPLAFNTFA